MTPLCRKYDATCCRMSLTLSAYAVSAREILAGYRSLVALLGEVVG